MRFTLFSTAIVTALALVSPAQARDQIRIVGSSTVYPFSTVVAENFGKAGTFKTPILESTGTGGGLKLFCEGAGEKTPDVANASRQIKDSEVELCTKNGVKGILEYKIGYDGIVFGASKESPDYALTRQQIFLGLARQVPGKDGKMVDNPYTNWNDVDSKLPKEPILVYGPPPTSGTRDSLVELVLIPGCETIPVYKEMTDDARKAACSVIREDGKYVETGENDNLIIQRLESNPHSLGIFGYSFLEENADKIKAASVEGKQPSFDDIATGIYPVSRSMFIYAKKQHIGVIPGVQEFLNEFFSDKAMGEYGYLPEKGMITLTEKELAEQRKHLADGITIKQPE